MSGGQAVEVAGSTFLTQGSSEASLELVGVAFTN